MTPKPVAWVPRCVKLWLDIFIMAGILWQYRTQGLFTKCAPHLDVTKNSHDGCSGTAAAGKKKKKEKKKRGDKMGIFITVSFNLVKVHCPIILYITSWPTTWTSFRFSCITIMVYFYVLIFRRLQRKLLPNYLVKAIFYTFALWITCHVVFENIPLWSFRFFFVLFFFVF